MRTIPELFIGLMAMFLLFVIMPLLLGCSGLDARQQRVASGAAIGGALACFPGAVVGGFAGWVSDGADPGDHHPGAGGVGGYNEGEER